MNRRRRGAKGSGFSLLETVVALVIFQVGVLGVAGMVLLGQRSMRRAQLVMRGTLEAARVGDSVLLAGDDTPGLILRPWGAVSWEASGEGGVRVVALSSGEADTLAVLLLWPLPAVLWGPPDPPPRIGGAPLRGGET